VGSWRTHLSADLRTEHIGQKVRLCGWVHTVREHGDIRFVLMRDKTGTIQVNLQNSAISRDLWSIAKELKPEYCIQVDGEIVHRPEDARNPDMATGDIEIRPDKLVVLNKCPPLPFPINRETEISEELALKYRYLQMRRPSLSETIRMRHELVLFLRNMMSGLGFMEIETPLLTRSTPEGARDFLVPSRIYPGKFFALPQSPQQYKELLMVGGMDRYFQFARCLRDEDARADRQAEHTQLDFEMSFVDREDIIDVLERVFLNSAERFSDKKAMESPIPRLSYKDALERYGSDKPDLRFGLELIDLSSAFLDCPLPGLRSAATDKGMTLRGFAIADGGVWSRKELDSLRDLPTQFGGNILSWVAFRDGAVRGSSIKKILDDERLESIRYLASPGPNDLLLFAGGEWKSTLEFLGKVRVHFGKKLDLLDSSLLAFLFVIDFPQFEWNEDEKRLDPVHHMFVLPKEDHIDLLDSDPLSILSTQVDMVCNGYELCSGSLRIHTRDLQLKVMDLIGLSSVEADKEFGHLLAALEFGAPPHGGAAPGLDRLLMVLRGTDRMSDVVAFPKTYSGRDLLMDAPAEVDAKQLCDLHLKLVESEDQQ